MASHGQWMFPTPQYHGTSFPAPLPRSQGPPSNHYDRRMSPSLAFVMPDGARPRSVSVPLSFAQSTTVADMYHRTEMSESCDIQSLPYVRDPYPNPHHQPERSWHNPTSVAGTRMPHRDHEDALNPSCPEGQRQRPRGSSMPLTLNYPPPSPHSPSPYRAPYRGATPAPQASNNLGSPSYNDSSHPDLFDWPLRQTQRPMYSMASTPKVSYRPGLADALFLNVPPMNMANRPEQVPVNPPAGTVRLNASPNGSPRQQLTGLSASFVPEQHPHTSDTDSSIAPPTPPESNDPTSPSSSAEMDAEPPLPVFTEPRTAPTLQSPPRTEPSPVTRVSVQRPMAPIQPSSALQQRNLRTKPVPSRSPEKSSSARPTPPSTTSRRPSGTTNPPPAWRLNSMRAGPPTTTPSPKMPKPNAASGPKSKPAALQSKAADAAKPRCFSTPSLQLGRWSALRAPSSMQPQDEGPALVWSNGNPCPRPLTGLLSPPKGPHFVPAGSQDPLTTERGGRLF